MKNQFRILVLVFSFNLFSSCDYIREPYTIPGPNGCTSPQPDFTPRSDPKRKVLIEDFTGHNCGNCPPGHIILSDLIAQNEDQIIGIALHSGSAEMDAYTAPKPPNTENSLQYDFRTSTATDVDLHFGLGTAGIPNGMVNRKIFGGTVVVSPATWGSKVSELLVSPPQMDIQLKNYYDPQENSICSYAYVQALEDLYSNYKLVLLITESGIINWQKYYGNTPELVPGYVHNHVLRASITNTWGVQVGGGSNLKSGDTEIQGYSISTAGTDWNINNLHVVAFVYDVATFEIIQAEELKVTP